MQKIVFLQISNVQNLQKMLRSRMMMAMLTPKCGNHGNEDGSDDALSRYRRHLLVSRPLDPQLTIPKPQDEIDYQHRPFMRNMTSGLIFKHLLENY